MRRCNDDAGASDDSRFDDLPDALPRGVVRSRPRVEDTASRAAVRPTTPAPRRPVDARLPAPVLGHERAGRITAIEAQKRHPDRVNVFIDGELALGLFADVAAQLALTVNRCISREALAEAANEETRQRALRDAYTLLSYRDRSEQEIIDRLARRGYAEEVIAATCASLCGAGYLDDAAFARRWVEARAHMRGSRALAQELRLKGVDAGIIGEALSARSGDREMLPDEHDVSADAAGAAPASEMVAARRMARARVGGAPADRSPASRRRLAGFLQRRGFSWSTIRPILDELYASAEGRRPPDFDEPDGMFASADGEDPVDEFAPE
jgi:regulatory protein